MKFKNIILGLLCGMHISLCPGLDLINAFSSEDTTEKVAQQAGGSVYDAQLMIKFINEKQDFLVDKFKVVADIASIGKLITSVKDKVVKTDAEEFYKTQLLGLLTTIYQDMHEIQQIIEEARTTLKEYDTFFASFIENPLPMATEISATWNWGDLLTAHAALEEQTSKISQLQRRKETLSVDIEKRKKTIEDIASQLARQQQHQQNFAQFSEQKKSLANVDVAKLKLLTLEQQGELLDYAVKQLEYRKILTELKVEAEETELKLIALKVRIINEQLKPLRDLYTTIRNNLIISDEQLEKARQELEEKRQSFITKRDQALQQERAWRVRLRESQQEDAARSANWQNIPDIESYKTWSKIPETPEEWDLVVTIGSLSARRSALENRLSLIQAQIELDNAKTKRHETRFHILESWNKMNRHRMGGDNEDFWHNDLKRHEAAKSQVEIELSEFTKKREKAIEQLTKMSNSAEMIDKMLVKIRTEEVLQLFGSQRQRYTALVRSLDRAREDIDIRRDAIANLVEVYSATVHALNERLKELNIIIETIQSRSFWQQRSDTSIELEDLKQLIPDLERFFKDVQVAFFALVKSILSFDVASFLNLFPDSASGWFSILLYVLLVFLGYFLLSLTMPLVEEFFIRIDMRYPMFTYITGCLSLVANFIYQNLFLVYSWITGFLFVYLGFFSIKISIAFYLCTMPLLLYLVYRFMNLLITTNERRNYLFIARYYVQRVSAVLSIFFYCTVVLMSVRQAFLQGEYVSQVPIIFLAVNFILFQIALLLLIRKDFVVRSLPVNTPMWRWIAEAVEDYYYILFTIILAIVVMSNPYVGYGQQVLYVISRLLITAILIPLFSWIHESLKHFSSDIFFYYSDGDAVRERFGGGKTWYGMFVVISFIFFILLGAYCAAWIWGQGITLDTIKSFFSYPLYNAGIDTYGKSIEVTPWSLFYIVLFLAGGVAINYVIDTFLLRRIFDPLLIGAGVQNTILTLTRYVILIAAFLMGVQSANLEGVVFKLGILVGLIGYAGRETINDFFSYFVILVQRPIKIGDFVQIEDGVIGVVRQITPRATILRHKNSVTYIIPNSVILTKTVANWHYSRTFSAFQDIRVTVPYAADPLLVRDLFVKALDDHPAVLKNPRPLILLDDFTENGFAFRIRGFVSPDRILDIFEIASEIRYAVVMHLKRSGIQLSVAQREIKVTENEVKKIIESALAEKSDSSTTDMPDHTLL